VAFNASEREIKSGSPAFDARECAWLVRDQGINSHHSAIDAQVSARDA
jgi:hypothetical protein